MTAIGAAAAAVVLAIGLVLRPRYPPRAVGTGPRRSRPGRRATAGRVSGRPGAATVLVVAAALVVTGPFGAAAAVAASALAPRWRRVRAATRRRAAIAAAFPDAIDLVVLGVRAGLLPSAAVAAAVDYVPAELCPAFDAVATRVARGDRFADALLELEIGIGNDARPLIDSFASAERYGLPLAPVLERLATEARQQRRRMADTAARQLPVRLSLPLVLCTLPSFVLLAIVPLLLGALSSLHVQ